MPDWPSTVSLPSPGSQLKRSLPEPSGRGVGALVAVGEVVAGAAEQDVGAVAAAQRVVVVAAVEGQLAELGDVADRGERVLAVAAGRAHALHADGLRVVTAQEVPLATKLNASAPAVPV